MESSQPVSSPVSTEAEALARLLFVICVAAVETIHDAHKSAAEIRKKRALALGARRKAARAARIERTVTEGRRQPKRHQAYVESGEDFGENDDPRTPQSGDASNEGN